VILPPEPACQTTRDWRCGTPTRRTRRVYAKRGADTDVETTAYGASGTGPPVPSVAVRTADTSELERSWFVVYRSTERSERGAALIAVRGDDEWTGCWTYDADRVAEVSAYLDRTDG
jgi:hypothetical protein